jgi:hypothetical protein
MAQSLESEAALGLFGALACLRWKSFHQVEGSCLGPPGICVSQSRCQPAYWHGINQPAHR